MRAKRKSQPPMRGYAKRPPNAPHRYEKQPPNAPHNPNPKLYLTGMQLRERYGGRSDMWVTRVMRSDPDFPRPILVGRYRFWALDDIERYEREVAAHRVVDDTSRAGRHGSVT